MLVRFAIYGWCGDQDFNAIDCAIAKSVFQGPRLNPAEQHQVATLPTVTHRPIPDYTPTITVAIPGVIRKTWIRTSLRS